MTMKIHIHILLTILILVAATGASAIAQNDNAQGQTLFQNASSDPIEGEPVNVSYIDSDNDTIGSQLRQLQSLYSAGKYRTALQLSQRIKTNPHLSKEQNQDRLKYTIAAYKDLEYDHEADSLAKIFRQRDPFYIPNSIDPLSFKRTLANYDTKPKFSVFAAIGKVNTHPHLDTVRTIIDSVSLDPDYKIEGYTVQIGFEYRPLKLFTISIAPSVTAYDITRTMQRAEFAIFHYNETSIVFALPLYVEAGLYRKKEIFVPSIYAGAQLKYMFHSEYKAYTEAIGTFNVIPDYKDDTYTKTKLNYSVLGGIRLNINHRRMTYFADFGLSMDMLSYNNPAKKYRNNDFLYQHLYIPDIYRMMEYTVKLGIKVNLQYKTIAKNNYGY